LTIRETESLQQQGTAAIACLLSGLNTFKDDGLNDQRNIEVVTGLHGFHLYAAEHWIEYLLTNPRNSANDSATSSLFILANQFAEKLDKLNKNMSTDDYEQRSSTLDSRFALLQQYPILQSQVKIALKIRSQKAFEEQLWSLNSTFCHH